MKFLFNGIEIDSKIGAPDFGIPPEFNGCINIPVKAGDQLKLKNDPYYRISYDGILQIKCIDDDKEPRTWTLRGPQYIWNTSTTVVDGSKLDPDEDVLVIEKSAYDELKIKLEEATKELNASKTFKELLGENGQVCGLEDEIDMFKAKIEISNEKLSEAVDLIDILAFALETTAALGFGLVGKTALDQLARWKNDK